LHIVGTQLFTISGVSNYRQGDMFDIVGTHLFTISGVSNYRQGDMFDIVHILKIVSFRSVVEIIINSPRINNKLENLLYEFKVSSIHP
jgi:hypothetical protein